MHICCTPWQTLKRNCFVEFRGCEFSTAEHSKLPICRTFCFYALPKNIPLLVERFSTWCWQQLFGEGSLSQCLPACQCQLIKQIEFHFSSRSFPALPPPLLAGTWSSSLCVSVCSLYCIASISFQFGLIQLLQFLVEGCHSQFAS